jgi:hypothetical protein
MSDSLAHQQQRLQQFLLGAGAPVSRGSIAPAIRTTTRVPAAMRLGIYAEAYRARLHDALATDYAGLQKYLGDSTFAALAQAYIDANPSTHFSLRWFGKALPEFVAATAPYNGHLELAELARFEWAQGLVFDAPDVEPLTIADLAAVPAAAWPTLVFTLMPAMRIETLQSNAPPIWSALNDDAAPPELELSAPIAWLLWRQDLRILFRPLAMQEAIALQAFAAGDNFSEVCAQLCEHMAAATVPGYTAGMLRHWIGSGLIAAINERE